MFNRQKLYITLSPEAKVLLKKLADKRGLSQSSYIEQLIRDQAERLNVVATEKEIEAMAG